MNEPRTFLEESADRIDAAANSGPARSPYPSLPRSDPAPMSDAEYRGHLDVVAAGVRLLRLVPVDRVRDALGMVEALGPILDPTAYMRGGADNLRDQRELLDAVAAVVTAAERIETRAGVRHG